VPRLELKEELIDNVCPNKLALHLKEKGWEKERVTEGVAEIWVYPKRSPPLRVLLPLDREYGDFGIKIIDVMRVLAKLEMEQLMQTLLIEEEKPSSEPQCDRKKVNKSKKETESETNLYPK
jgi:hypothetical protein